MRTVSKKLSEQIMQEAYDWFNNAPAAPYFHDTKSCSVRSVAEFIANTRYNRSLFRNLRKKDSYVNQKT